MHILVLGGYGLIGAAICRRLVSDGHAVTGLGRSLELGRRAALDVKWKAADIATLTAAADWRDFLHGVDVVVNASGALQNGFEDKIDDVQRKAILALIAACEENEVAGFVQISAPGASEKSGTEFYRSKAAADAGLKASSLRWTIFRPGLVVAPQAYGGTSLLRMLAGFPMAQPIILENAQIQTVAVDDVADAVARACDPTFPGGDFDLVEAAPRSLLETVLAFRRWLGFGEPKFILRIPAWLGGLIAKGADLAGWLGWRPALRTTALRVLRDGVIADGEAWRDAAGADMKALPETLAEIPATLQERLYARSMLAFPVLVIVLAVFWIASGVIGLLRADQAFAVLEGALPPVMARAAVLGGGVIDIAIGLAMSIRPLLRWACVASIIVALAYLVGASMLTPHLWLDPLGPLVKIAPAIALALIVMALGERR